MPNRTASWLRWILGMGERRKLGDVALDIVLFAGMVTDLASLSAIVLTDYSR